MVARKPKTTGRIYVTDVKLKKLEKWVKEQPSCVSGFPADDAHHIKSRGWFGGSTKPKLAMIPLTREEHTEFHLRGQKTFEADHVICQLHCAVFTLEKAFKQGVIGFTRGQTGEVLRTLEDMYERGLIIIK